MRFAISVLQYADQRGFDSGAFRAHLAQAEEHGFHSAWAQEQVLGAAGSLSPLETLTYHDSCYLGRWNREFDAPRDVIAAVGAPGGIKELTRSKRLFVLKADKDQPDAAVTHDFVMDQLVIHGSVNKVVDHILALREEIGDFGEIVYAGMDWVDPSLAKRSMQLMAEEVMPRVNAAIGKSAAAA